MSAAAAPARAAARAYRAYVAAVARPQPGVPAGVTLAVRRHVLRRPTARSPARPYSLVTLMHTSLGRANPAEASAALRMPEPTGQVTCRTQPESTP